MADALADKAEKPDAQEIFETVQDYKRFYKQNRKQEEPKITADELNILSLRRWHYDHPEEYKEFTATFQKAYDGDMTFIQTNFFFLMEMFSTKGVMGMMKIVASLFPGNKHYQQSLMGNDDNPLKGRLSEMLDSSLNNEAIRERLLHKNPYLLEKVSWTGISSDFKISLTVSRTQQLCDAMTVTKDLMANLLLAAGGRGGISFGGGGSTSELTNWDGTKKNTGWGR